jgi:hypothetical protein
MATTTIKILAATGQTTVTLTSNGGTGTASNPYTLTRIAGTLCSISVTQSLTGNWHCIDGVGTETLINELVDEEITVELGVGNVPTLEEIAGVVGVGAGDGDRVVVVTVRDDASQVVPGAKVTIQTAAGATIAGRTLNTNSSGVATFNLDDGSYKGLVTTTSGYAVHTAQAFTVNEDNEAVTLTITRTTIADPPDAGVCRLIAYVFWNDEPVSGATVSARLKGINQGTDGKLMSRVAKEATTNSSGLATLDLIQGGEFVDGDGVYVIEAIHNRNVIWQIESAMPDETSVNVEDLIS